MLPSTAILLLSGGLDSLVNAALARERHTVVRAVTFDYGQRAAAREIAAAANICVHWHLAHTVIALPWLHALTTTALVNRSAMMPAFHPTDAELNDAERVRSSANAVWVPNRNGVFINVAAAIAESMNAQWIVTGFNAEEAATFPDNTPEYVDRANAALEFSTLSRPTVVSYTQAMTKFDIVQCALAHDIPLQWCWPCYDGGTQWCGHCESCARFQRAVTRAGLVYDTLRPS